MTNTLHSDHLPRAGERSCASGARLALPAVKHCLRLVAVLCAVSGARAQEPRPDIPAPPEFEEARRIIEMNVAAGVLPSAAVAVIRGNKVVWAEGFGYADLENRTPATANTIYRLASISKPITATGLMIQVDRGRVALDAPANDFLEGAALRAPLGSPRDMTVRRLANHTAGLPVHYNFYFNGVPPLPMNEAIARYGFAATPPGTDWEYSNLGFGILNHITERAAGVPWRNYMEREIFDRIGMHRTSDRIRPGYEADAAVQYGTDLGGRFYPTAHYEFDHPGGSALCASAHDLARFALLHLNGGSLDGVRILSERSTAEMQRITAERGPDTGVGVAWFIDDEWGHRRISHSGGMPGVATLLRVYPDDMAACLLLTNCGNRVEEIPRRIARVLLEPSHGAPESAPASNEIGPTFAEEQWVGVWRGSWKHHGGDLPVEIHVTGRAEATVKIGSLGTRALEEVSINAARFTGSTTGFLPVQDGYHGRVTVRFLLHCRGDRLSGAAICSVPGYFSLSHWIDLAKAETP